MTRGKSVPVTMRELMPIVIERIEKGQTAELPVRGVSMQPFLMNNRDRIILASQSNREPRIGDLYMFRRTDGSYAMHRVCGVNADGSVDFVGDNQFLTEKIHRANQLSHTFRAFSAPAES